MKSPFAGPTQWKEDPSLTMERIIEAKKYVDIVHLRASYNAMQTLHAALDAVAASVVPKENRNAQAGESAEAAWGSRDAAQEASTNQQEGTGANRAGRAGASSDAPASTSDSDGLASVVLPTTDGEPTDEEIEHIESSVKLGKVCIQQEKRIAELEGRLAALRSAPAGGTPDIPLHPVTNEQIAARIAEAIQWEEVAPRKWGLARWEQFNREARCVLDGAAIAALRSAPAGGEVSEGRLGTAHDLISNRIALRIPNASVRDCDAATNDVLNLLQSWDDDTALRAAVPPQEAGNG